MACFKGRVCLVWLAIAIGIPGYSKPDSPLPRKVRYSLLAGLSASGIPGVFTHGFYFSTEKGRNKLLFGPQFGYKLFINEHSFSIAGNDLTLSGFGLLYQFFPNPTGKRYDLFFQYELNWHRFTDEDRMPDGQGGFEPYSATEQYLINFVSYGLRVRFLRHFYFHHNIGVGYMAGWRKFNGRETGSVRTGLQGNMRIGLGFTFPGRKK